MPQNASLVLFGALGDLAWRLVGPAIYDLHCKNQLPSSFRLNGVDRAIDTEKLIDRLRDGASRFTCVPVSA